jgi:2-polyprenyl-3-methyl-5-hydroxy-6-metoxy-1,4-benzoquinol methylase
VTSEAFIDKDGIKIYHPDVTDVHSDYEAQGLKKLYEVEREHFWFVARKELLIQVAADYVGQGGKVLEVGAGTGFIARGLIDLGFDVAVGDIHASGLRYALGYGVKNCLQFDLLRAPMTDEYDAVCMFDVLEHIEDDGLALNNVNKVLKGDGTIILSVPAHMSLWSRVDAVSYHKRRYNRASLIRAVEKAGFEIEGCYYFFSILTPLIASRVIFDRDSGEPVSREELDAVSVPTTTKFINSILLWALRLERKIGNIFSKTFGSSIVLVATKRDVSVAE